MNHSEPTSFPSIRLSHFELYVEDVASMENFYTRFLGFVVTDRGTGSGGMVFLSRHPEEHHQLVLNPVPLTGKRESPVDHISFRVESIADLRVFYRSLQDSRASLQTVSHGTTWSIYFRDPEDNRLELFADTPWHVNQPCRFEIDLDLDDAELLRYTESMISGLPGFSELGEWKAAHAGTVAGTDS